MPGCCGCFSAPPGQDTPQAAASPFCSWICPPRAPNRSIPIVDQHFLNPFEKWFRYGRFPWTFFSHVVLLVLVTIQAIVYFNRDVKHVSMTVRHFQHLFVGTADAKRSSSELHTPQALQGAVNRAVRNHFFVNNVSIVNYKLEDPDRLQVQAIWRTGETTMHDIDNARYANHTDLLDSTGGGEDYLREAVPFLYDLDKLPQVAALNMDHEMQELGYLSESVYCWKLKTSFDGTEAGAFKGGLSVNARDCQGKVWQLSHILHIAVIGLACMSSILLFRKIFRSSRTIRRLRRSPEAWKNLSKNDVLLLFSPWWGFTLITHVAQIASCGLALQAEPDIGTRFRGIGFSCFLTWVNITQYFESFPGFYYAFHTMSTSAGGVLRFLVSVVPLFYGFVLLGVCLFWQSPYFSDPVASSCALFALLNGDMVHDTFDEVYGISGFLGHVYVYLFVFLFIYVILNVNISIVTDAYEKAKHHPQRETRRALRRLAGAAGEAGAQAPLRSPAASPPGTPRRSPPRSPDLGFSLPPTATPSTCTAGTPHPAGAAGSSILQPALQRAGTSGSAMSYMTPRYFWSARIQEALAAVYPERPLHSVPLLASGGAGASAAGAVNQPPLLEDFVLSEGVESRRQSDLAEGEDEQAVQAFRSIESLLLPPQASFEMSPRGGGWEDFDCAWAAAQATCHSLLRAPQPGCNEEAARQLAAALVQLKQALNEVTAARLLAGGLASPVLGPAPAGSFGVGVGP